MFIRLPMHVSPLSWIGFACALVAAGIMIYYLWRRPPLDAAGKSVMMLGVGVLPIMVAMIGNMEGLAATEKQGFCGSCHTMDMWIEDANDPESESLAAIHSRTTKFGGKSCYVCHKDYGMFGYAMTKLGGMGHVYKFLSEWMWYDRDEVLDKIHIARPFKNENCMQCHSTTGAIWSGTQDHAGLVGDLRSGETSCVSAGCHGYAHPFSKPEDETPSAEEVHSSIHGSGVEAP
jgi:cytochrome c-type protein NapC